MAVLTRFAEELKETASIEKAAKLEGRKHDHDFEVSK